MPATTPMLDGITVLDLSSVGPAARAARWLADYGASVVKVGPVPSRDGVQITPPFHAYSAQRAMRRFLVDLKAPEGVEAFLRLATNADVVIESFRPGVVDRLGIGYTAVTARNPGIVYCSTTGYGQTGPRSDIAGHDLNYSAVSGFLALCGRASDGAPPIPGATIADSAGGGMHAAMAILAALVRRQAVGAGAYLDVSVADGMLGLMALAVDEYLATGDEPAPGHGLLHGEFACYGIYRTRDARWLAVAAIESQFWANLCETLGLGQWIPHQYDTEVQDAIRAALCDAFAARDRDEWVALLAARNTCVAPVQSIAEVAADEQFHARDAFVKASHPEHGTFNQVGPVFAGMVRTDPVEVPVTETATDDLLDEAGYSLGEIAAMRDAGVVA